MRIVGGRHRGRRLLAPTGDTVRPTSDRAREALFNILSHGRLAAGGVPLAGAAEAVFIERDPEAIAVLRRNVAALGESAHAEIVPGDAARPPRARLKCAVAFVDPPYRSGLAAPALEALDRADWLAPDALAIVELGVREQLAPPAGFALLDERVYGAARLVFLRRNATAVAL